MKPVRILIDLDEVLADFVGAAVSLWDKNLSDVMPYWLSGEWDCIGPLGRSLGLIQPMSSEEFWFRINAKGVQFWQGLNETPYLREMISLAARTTDDWHVITSPSKSIHCYTGKAWWLKYHLGQDFDRFAITPHKEIFAGPRVILIDDSDANIQKFRAAGGSGIVFPRHTNSLHGLKNEPMKYVKQALTACLCLLDMRDREAATM